LKKTGTMAGRLADNYWNLNPAIGEFAQDARRKGRRHTLVFQAPDNAADWVKSPIPQGGKRWQNTCCLQFTEKVNFICRPVVCNMLL